MPSASACSPSSPVVPWWAVAVRYLNQPTTEVAAYQAALLDRFTNARMRDRLDRIAHVLMVARACTLPCMTPAEALWFSRKRKILPLPRLRR